MAILRLALPDLLSLAMWGLVCTLGYVLADQAEFFLCNHAIMVGVKLKYQFINYQREHKRINTRMKK